MSFVVAPVAYQYIVHPQPGSGVATMLQLPAMPGMLPGMPCLGHPVQMLPQPQPQQQQQQQQQQQAQHEPPPAPPQPAQPQQMPPPAQPSAQQPAAKQPLGGVQLPLPVPHAHPRNSNSKPTADILEIMTAVESLYRDELKPYGRILRKRLAEQAKAAGKPAADIGMKHLRVICEACPWLRVQDAEGADWAVLIPGQPESFVDVYSPTDGYPTAMWAEAEDYFRSLEDTDALLPGGRYSCAQVLMGRRLPFLSGRSLGQVCHIVQLAISQKKLLGYLNGSVVPYSRSQSMVKEQCAESQQPCASMAQGQSLASWEMVRSGLHKLLGHMSGQRRSLPLSNIKRLFRTSFNAELSETALGYAKLSDLLQDPRLRDLCEVRLHGHGYVIVPVRASARALREVPPSPASTRSQASYAVAPSLRSPLASDASAYLSSAASPPATPVALSELVLLPPSSASGADLDEEPGSPVAWPEAVRPNSAAAPRGAGGPLTVWHAGSASGCSPCSTSPGAPKDASGAWSPCSVVAGPAAPWSPCSASAEAARGLASAPSSCSGGAEAPASCLSPCSAAAGPAGDSAAACSLCGAAATGSDCLADITVQQGLAGRYCASCWARVGGPQGEANACRTFGGGSMAACLSCPATPAGSDLLQGYQHLGYSVRNTFIHGFPGHEASAARRTRSVPADTCA